MTGARSSFNPVLERKSGVVVNHNSAAGYGHILSEGAEFWFHANDCEGDFAEIKPGDQVSFLAVRGNKGPKALRVRREGA